MHGAPQRSLRRGGDMQRFVRVPASPVVATEPASVRCPPVIPVSSRKEIPEKAVELSRDLRARREARSD